MANYKVEVWAACEGERGAEVARKGFRDGEDDGEVVVVEVVDHKRVGTRVAVAVAVDAVTEEVAVGPEVDDP